jgi:hypothetical protein
LACGTLLLLPSVLLTAGLLVTAFSNIQWIRYEPLWYLRRQALSSSVGPSPARIEILRRIHAGELSVSQLDELVDRVLLIQADATQLWNPQWGDWIESLHGKGKVSDARWTSYLSNAVAVRVTARSEVRRGDNLPVRTEILPARVGSGSTHFAETTTVYAPDGLLAPLSASFHDAAMVDNFQGKTSSGVLRLDSTRVAAADDGRQTLKAQVTIRVHDRTSASSRVVARNVDVDVPWTLVPADHLTISVVRDPSIRPHVEVAIKNVVVWTGSNYQPDWVYVSFDVDRSPVPLAYKIILRARDREWTGGSMSILSDTRLSFSTGREAKDLSTDRVDVILRPDEATAINSVDVRSYWEGEIVYKDLPIQSFRRRPSTSEAQSSASAPFETSPANRRGPATQGS